MQPSRNEKGSQTTSTKTNQAYLNKGSSGSNKVVQEYEQLKPAQPASLDTLACAANS